MRTIHAGSEAGQPALLDSLEGVRRAGPDRWTARCAAHDDSRPSLSITAGADGRILIHCFAGCTPQEILQALGLEWSALFTESRAARPWRRPPSSEWRRAWASALRRAHEQGRFLRRWEPIWGRADFLRHGNRLADAYRAHASRMRCDDPAMWDAAEIAVAFEAEARLVEAEADDLVARARVSGRGA